MRSNKIKKRAMKKWIPKGIYCHGNGTKKYPYCKWLRFNKNKPEQLNGYCMYLKIGDWQDDGTMLLFDVCKECSVKYD